MNLNMIRPENETEDFLPAITKNCDTLIEQTHRKAEETLEFEMIKPREIYQFNPHIPIDGLWLIGLTNLEVYASTFNINTTNSKFELHTDNFDEFSFEGLKDELEVILSISDNTPNHLQHETIGPRIIQAYRNLRLEKSSNDGYIIFLTGYARTTFRHFESYPRIVVGLDEDDVQY